MILNLITKLPQDLLDVQHILPFWYTILYYFLWIAGFAAALCLAIYLLSKFAKYLRSRPPKPYESRLARERRYSRNQILKDIDEIYKNYLQTQNYRKGLHTLSSTLRTYFEVQTKKNIEEMTAAEIREHVVERKDLGVYFTGLSVAQFQEREPNENEFVQHYEEGKKLV